MTDAAFKTHFSFPLNWCLEEKFHLLLKWAEWNDWTWLSHFPRAESVSRGKWIKLWHTWRRRKPPPTAVAASFPTFWNKNPAHLQRNNTKRDQWFGNRPPSSPFHCFPNKTWMSSHFFWSCPLPAQKPSMLPKLVKVPDLHCLRCASGMERRGRGLLEGEIMGNGNKVEHSGVHYTLPSTFLRLKVSVLEVTCFALLS